LLDRPTRNRPLLTTFKAIALAGCLGAVAGCVSSDETAFDTTAGFASQSVADLATASSGGPGSTVALTTQQTESGYAADAADVTGSLAEATGAADGSAAGSAVAEAAPADGATPANDLEDVAIAATQPAPPSEELVVESAVASAPVADDVPAPGSMALAVNQQEAPRGTAFSRLFSRNQAGARTPANSGNSPRADEPPVTIAVEETVPAAASPEQVAAAADEPATQVVAENGARPLITGSIAAESAPRAHLAVAASDSGAPLPGVRVNSLFQISSGGSLDDTGGIQLASAAGLARLGGARLQTQTEHVNIACLKPRLVQTLNHIQAHYGRPVVVTSGFRDARHNRRVGGASESKHMSCEAADIQVAGVSKWQLAEFVRALPGRGGVGTYCHTESVHVDIGGKRDWNWRCSRRR
jgi:uncharacterized protein YcbK (DUF882 family)